MLRTGAAAGACEGCLSLCLWLMSQVRGSFPSAYDCSLGYSLGLMCGVLATSPCVKQLPSAAVFISNPTASPSAFSPLVVPLAAAAVACGLTLKQGAAAAAGIAACEAAGAFDVQQECPSQAVAAAAVSCEVQQREFLLKDSYLNSGPIQFKETAGAADNDRQRNFLLSARK